jgi:hypothetical protein
MWSIFETKNFSRLCPLNMDFKLYGIIVDSVLTFPLHMLTPPCFAYAVLTSTGLYHAPFLAYVSSFSETWAIVSPLHGPIFAIYLRLPRAYKN